MALHTVILVAVALFSAPLLVLFNNICSRTNAAHLEVLQGTDAGRKIDLLPWKRLERSKFLLGLLFLSTLGVIAWSRFIAGGSWSTIDSVSFWTIALLLTASSMIAEHYNIEDLIVSSGGGKRHG